MEHFLGTWPCRGVEGAVLIEVLYKAYLLVEELTYVHMKVNTINNTKCGPRQFVNKGYTGGGDQKCYRIAPQSQSE